MDFMNDKTQFKKSVYESFAALDLNKDDILSCMKLHNAFKTMRLIETHFGIDETTTLEPLTKLYDSIFEKFDCDGRGTVDLEDGLGLSPIYMALEDGDKHSLLTRDANLEASKLSS
ncbi:hypothetical protein I3843_14G076400 [Carya illinoinensis]|nr:hypothetical protein I3843_14G076400 [Carya illinoinensis]